MLCLHFLSSTLGFRDDSGKWINPAAGDDHVSFVVLRICAYFGAVCKNNRQAWINFFCAGGAGKDAELGRYSSSRPSGLRIANAPAPDGCCPTPPRNHTMIPDANGERPPCRLRDPRKSSWPRPRSGSATFPIGSAR